MSSEFVCCFFLGRGAESVVCAEMEGLTACSASPGSLPGQLDEGRNRGSPIRRTDSPSKKKGIFSGLSQTMQKILNER